MKSVHRPCENHTSSLVWKLSDTSILDSSFRNLLDFGIPVDAVIQCCHCLSISFRWGRCSSLRRGCGPFRELNRRDVQPRHLGNRRLGGGLQGKVPEVPQDFCRPRWSFNLKWYLKFTYLWCNTERIPLSKQMPRKTRRLATDSTLPSPSTYKSLSRSVTWNSPTLASTPVTSKYSTMIFTGSLSAILRR